MYAEGCKWDHNKEMCSINYDRKAEGCMKCDDLKHKHTCTSLSNCYWNGSKGTCGSCNDAKDQNSCNKDTIGQCQWKSIQLPTGGNSPHRCYPADLYPLIYEWIWYNRWFLVSVFVCLVIIWKLPADKVPFPMKIGIYILKLVLLFVTIPGLMVVPGLQRADGGSCSDETKVSKALCEAAPGNVWTHRNFYMDPPPDPKNPGWTDFLHNEDQGGAIWPDRLYDGEWDKFIKSDDVLQKLVDSEINATILNWTSLFWGLLRGWNVFVNSLGDKDITVIILLFIIFIGTLYRISRYFGANPHPVYTLYTVMGGVVLFYLLRKLLQTLRKENKAADGHVNGRELKNHYITPFTFLYQLDEDKDICPYGCVYGPKTLQTKGDKQIYIPDPAKKCKDTRSVFAFGGSLDPDPYISNADTKLWNEETNGKYTYTCPPKRESNGYPYNWLCKDHKKKCLGSTKYNKTSLKDKADKICTQYYSKHAECHDYSQAGQNKDQLDLRKPNGDIEKIQCQLISEKDTNCPFSSVPIPLVGKPSIEQRRPIKVWSSLYDKIAGKDLRTLSREQKTEWKNQVRYEIVDQQFTKDKLYGSP